MTLSVFFQSQQIVCGIGPTGVNRIKLMLAVHSPNQQVSLIRREGKGGRPIGLPIQHRNLSKRFCFPELDSSRSSDDDANKRPSGEKTPASVSVLHRANRA